MLVMVTAVLPPLRAVTIMITITMAMTMMKMIIIKMTMMIMTTMNMTMMKITMIKTTTMKLTMTLTLPSTVTSPQGLGADYGLSEVCSAPVVVHSIEGDHDSFIQGESAKNIAKIINAAL